MELRRTYYELTRNLTWRGGRTPSAQCGATTAPSPLDLAVVQLSPAPANVWRTGAARWDSYEFLGIAKKS